MGMNFNFLPDKERHLSSLIVYFNICNPDCSLDIHEFALIYSKSLLLPYFWWENGKEDKLEGNFIKTFPFILLIYLIYQEIYSLVKKNIDISLEYQKGITNLSQRNTKTMLCKSYIDV